MHFGKKAAVAAAAFTGLMVASAAYAGDANGTTCARKASEVRSAIAAAQPGQAKEAAAAQAKIAQEFCGASYYTKGVALYTKALTLLGEPSKS